MQRVTARVAVSVLIALMTATACSSPDTNSAKSTASQPAASQPAPNTTAAANAAAYASLIETNVLDGLMDGDNQRPATFREMCDTIVAWACAIDRIESDGPGAITITLAPEDLWIAKWDGSSDWYEFGEHVGRSVYNFTNGNVRPPLTEIDVMTPEGEIAYLGNY